MIYGVIVPKPGRSGVAQNVRAKELNEIEKLIHKWAQQDGMRETFVDSHKYSEWLRIADMSDLFEFIEDLINDHSSTYKIHFELKRL
jgi:hypothetical protein